MTKDILLGSTLRELRGNRSLRDVAEMTGLSHTYIADLEKGIRRVTETDIHPSPTVLRKLAEAYNASYEWLMFVAGYLGRQTQSFDSYHGYLDKQSDQTEQPSDSYLEDECHRLSTENAQLHEQIQHLKQAIQHLTKGW